MQFKHPEILYALFLLIIPIIVHFFQLRRFKKVPFTNVKFLKNIELQTRKSSRIKKLLILTSRLLLFASLIVAFTQPFLSNDKKTKPSETFIYLDNSYSMQAKGGDGELLKRATQDIIENSDQLKNFNLITNNSIYENIDPQNIKNILLGIEYYPIKVDLKTILLRIQNKIKNNSALHNIFLISDFQKTNIDNNILLDTINNYFIVKTQGKSPNNVSVDSVYISSQNNEQVTLKVVLKKFGKGINNNSISLFNDDMLAGRTSVDFDKNNAAKVIFTVPNSDNFKGKLQVEDNELPFDNSLFFNISRPKKINITAIGEQNNFLSKIYTNDEFNFTSSGINNLNYNTLQDQNVLILNELKSIPSILIKPLKQFLMDGGNLVIIPSTKIDTNSYNYLLGKLNIGKVLEKNNNELTITNINFLHPLLKGVFEKKVTNFQYPTVKSSYTTNFNNTSSILSFESGKNFISQKNSNRGSIYWFSSAINNDNSNFKNSPLIVPIFYNIGLYSYKPSELYYTIGNKNVIEVDTQLQKDGVLHIKNDVEDFIPQQQVTNKKVILNINDNPLNSGFANIIIDNNNIKEIAFNYNRIESNLTSINIEDYFKGNNVIITKSVDRAFTQLSEKYKTKSLWLYFLVLALLFLIIEMLLLKFFKP